MLIYVAYTPLTRTILYRTNARMSRSYGEAHHYGREGEKVLARIVGYAGLANQYVSIFQYWIFLERKLCTGMEDSHSVHLYLPPTSGNSPIPSTSSSSDIPPQPAGCTVTNDDVDSDGNALICVFDGHGGSTVAKFTGTTLHSRLAALNAYSKFALQAGSYP